MGFIIFDIPSTSAWWFGLDECPVNCDPLTQQVRAVQLLYGHVSLSVSLILNQSIALCVCVCVCTQSSVR